RWYSLRIRPYRVENKIDGAVVALFDVDAPKRYEEAMRSASALADAVVRASSSAIAILDAELHLRSASPRFVQLFSISTDWWQDRSLSDFALSNGFSELLALVQGDGTPGKDHYTVTLAPSNDSHPVAIEARSFSSFDIASRRMLLLTVSDVEASGSHQ